MASRLAGLLDQEQDRIAVAWAMALSRMRPSAYVYRPLEELRRLGRAYLGELVTYLDSGNPARLHDFVHREAALRLSMGFGAAEVVAGFIMFRDLAHEACAALVPQGPARLDLLRGLSEATDVTVEEFVSHFQRLSGERVRELEQTLDQLRGALAHQSIRDPVTDLFSAPYVDEYLTIEVTRAVRYRRAFALLVCEVDGFEDLRGRFGEHAANAALTKVGNVLSDLTRDVDVKGRTDESEFCVGMPETSLQAGFVVAERVRAEVAEASYPELTPGAITLSIGLGGHPDHATTAAGLLQAVRRARDRARQLGGNTVLYAERADET